MRALPLLVAGLVQQRAAKRRKAARDGKREHGVAPLGHAAVFGGVLVEAGRLELIAEAGLFQHDPHEDGHEDRQRYRDGDILVAAEELVEPERRQQRLLRRAVHLVSIGARHLLDVGEDHVGGVQEDPVEHDAGDDLVDIAERLEQADDRTGGHTGRDGEEHARQPAPAPRECRVQARA